MQGLAEFRQSPLNRLVPCHAATRIDQINALPPLEDKLFRLLQQSIDQASAAKTATLTLGELTQFLLRESETEIHRIMPGLSSDAIGCVVKLLSDEELIEIGRKIFNPLRGARSMPEAISVLARTRTTSCRADSTSRGPASGWPATFTGAPRLHIWPRPCRLSCRGSDIWRLGERTKHRARDWRTSRLGASHFSAYLTAAMGAAWATPGKIDHDITKVVSGIATTAQAPAHAATEAARLLGTLVVRWFKPN